MSAELGTRTCGICNQKVGAKEWCEACRARLRSTMESVRAAPREERAEELSLLFMTPLTVPFELVHERLEALVGRSVWTHELGSFGKDPHPLVAEILSGRNIKMQDVLDKIPGDQKAVLVFK